MWPFKTLLAFALFWVACLASLVNPIWGVVNYMMVYQVHPPDRWWGKPMVAVGIRFSLLAALFMMLGLFFAKRRVATIKPSVSLWELGIVGLVAVAALNILIGIGFDDRAQYSFEKFWKMLVFLLVLGRLATSRNNLRIVIWTIVVGSLYLGYDAYTAPKWRFAIGRLEVIGGPDMNTTSGASAHFAAMLPVIGIAFMIARHWKWRLLAALSGVLTFNAIILCRTRSTFIGLLAGTVVALLMAPRAKRFRIHALLIIGLGISYRLADPFYWKRMATLTNTQTMQADAAVVGRFDVWRASARILADYPNGVGLGNFPTIIGFYDSRYWNRSTHNTLVTCFVELGVVGGALFLALLLGSILYLYKSSRMADLTAQPVETKIIAYGLVVSLVTYFVAGLGTERFLCESFWWILVLPMCLFRMASAEARQTAEVPTLAHAPVSTDEPALSGGVPHAV
ncbi:MAG: O-antigen ligase family protein [Phycisphaerales bacterium]|nr:MAG: O-antigen ligase family protein [Phycisphaerales bacterium]